MGVMGTLTRAELLLQKVRSDILTGQLRPGSRLGVVELTQRYGVSSGMLREVLPRLEEQGLATSRSQQGYRVIEISVESLLHLTEARVAIETQVLRQSIASGDLEWETAVVAAHHRLSQLRSRGEATHSEWVRAHREFHAVLLDGCPNPQLKDVAKNLRYVSEVYQCWAAADEGQRAARDDEHAVLAQRCVERDIDGAVKALTEHIETTTAILIENRRQGITPAGILEGLNPSWSETTG